MSTVRHPNHVVMATGSEVIHAASDVALAQRRHVLACNGRAIQGGGWDDVVTKVTCKACLRALASGRAVWIGRAS
jgi:hypothetical protein